MRRFRSLLLFFPYYFYHSISLPLAVAHASFVSWTAPAISAYSKFVITTFIASSAFHFRPLRTSGGYFLIAGPLEYLRVITVRTLVILYSSMMDANQPLSYIHAAFLLRVSTRANVTSYIMRGHVIFSKCNAHAIFLQPCDFQYNI